MSKKHFHPSYIIESILLNRGMFSLVLVGVASLFFDPQYRNHSISFYRIFYLSSIAIGSLGLYFWILAFKMSDDKVERFYLCWLVCYIFEIMFFIYILLESIDQYLLFAATSKEYLDFSVAGLLVGLISALIISETFLNFKYELPQRKAGDD